MTNYEFLLLLLNNLPIYIGCLLLAIVIYILLFRKVWISILDPIALPVVGSVFGFSVVIFLYLIGEIKEYYFTSYLLTQIAFFVGFFIFNKSKIKFRTIRLKAVNQEEFEKHVFISSSAIDIICQLASYALIGIPLFMASHLEVTKDADGLGILTRITSMARAITLFMMFYYLFKKDAKGIFKQYLYFYLCFILIASVLGGSKSAFLIYGVIFFAFSILCRDQFPNVFNIMRRSEKKFILFGLGFALVFLAAKASGGLVTGLGDLGFRFLAFGDVYWYAYPNEMVEQIDGSRPFSALFSSLLASFRIVPWSELPRPIGMDMFALFSDADVVGGPNARHNVFGYIYYGYLGSIVFSFLMGSILGYCRSVFFNAHIKSVLKAAIVTFIYMRVCYIETDPTMVVFDMNSLLMVLPILLFAAICSYVFTKMYQTKTLNDNK